MIEFINNVFLSDILVLIAAYLLGSIPFSMLVAFAVGAGDIRKVGSGNPGATNVTRIAGKKAGFLAFLLDAGKGLTAVYLAQQLGTFKAIELLAAGAAVLGHIYPVWLKFKGGKGVATTFAVLLILDWKVGLLAMGVWLAVYKLARVSSLAAIFAMVTLPLISLLVTDRKGYAFIYLTVFLAGLVIFRHKDNIRRLLRGEEGKIR